jgi:hypothetical protein
MHYGRRSQARAWQSRMTLSAAEECARSGSEKCDSSKGWKQVNLPQATSAPAKSFCSICPPTAALRKFHTRGRQAQLGYLKSLCQRPNRRFHIEECRSSRSLFAQSRTKSWIRNQIGYRNGDRIAIGSAPFGCSFSNFYKRGQTGRKQRYSECQSLKGRQPETLERRRQNDKFGSSIYSRQLPVRQRVEEPDTAPFFLNQLY